jgi:tetratricopeptide (TPR) repeat protein
MKSTSRPPKTVEQMAVAARHALQQRFFKDAIAAYKELLKREKRPEWEQELARAYRERALQLAEKGMYQEAVVLWENQAKLGPEAAPSAEYLAWLVQAGQFAKLAGLIDSAAEALAQSPVGQRLPEALALLALENDKLLGQFPQDHAIVKHQPLVKRALAAYAAKRDDEVEACLRQIPSRSPYRNVRTLLKALLLLETDRAAAVEALGKIEADSITRGLADLLRRYGRTAGPEILHFSELTGKQQAVINKLNGYGKAQLNLLRDIRKVASTRSDRVAFETVLNNREFFGAEASRRFCRAELIHYPAGIALYERAFGKLPAFEHHRIQALHAEEERIPPKAANFWGQCIEELKKRPPEDRDLMTEALIYRHIAKLAASEVPEIAADALEKSLDLDPDDRDSYLALIKLYEELGAAKKGQEWLDKGLKRYPRDVDLLVSAMHAAGRRKAFKKAAGFAKTLLEVDPINSQARQFLIDAHIGHARKQFRAGRIDLAQQELDQARPLDPHRRLASLAMVEGLVASKCGDPEQTRRLLEEGVRIAGGGLGAQFQLAVEASLLDLPLSVPVRYVSGPAKNHLAGRHELMGLVKLLGQYQNEDKRRLSEALEKLKPTLKRSFKQPDLGDEDYFNLCQGLARVGQYELLTACAKEAAKRSPFAPSAIYFDVYAKCRGDAARMDSMDEYRLHMALDQAHRAKDHRIAVLIENFFRAFDQAQQPDFDDAFPFPIPQLGGKGAGQGVDPQALVKFLMRFMELSQMPRQELVKYISGSQRASHLKELDEAELLELGMQKLLDELGLDRSMLEALEDLPVPGKKPGKYR